MFVKIYEDNALGKLTDDDFKLLSDNYKSEQENIEKSIASISSELQRASDDEQNVERFLKIVDKYTEISELTYELLRDFIDKILIFENDKVNHTRKIVISYNFVGNIS